MTRSIPFGEVVDAVDNLSADDQEALMIIVRRRLAEKKRAALVEEIKESRKEFAEGKCRPVSADQLMKEILT